MLLETTSHLTVTIECKLASPSAAITVHRPVLLLTKIDTAELYRRRDDNTSLLHASSIRAPITAAPYANAVIARSNAASAASCRATNGWLGASERSCVA